MGFRFQKRIKLLPGISLNVGKRGASISMGPRGMRTTISARGVKQSYGIPGTGIRYETPLKKWGNQDSQRRQVQFNQQPVQYVPVRESLWRRIMRSLGF